MLESKPGDAVFQLAFLAALNLVLFWFPIWYWSTYQPSGDERDGGVLCLSFIVCPTTWVLGFRIYFNSFRGGKSVRFPAVFHVACTLLYLMIISTLLGLVSRFL